MFVITQDSWITTAVTASTAAPLPATAPDDGVQADERSDDEDDDEDPAPSRGRGRGRGRGTNKKQKT